jgi:hypothetical protein
MFRFGNVAIDGTKLNVNVINDKAMRRYSWSRKSWPGDLILAGSEVLDAYENRRYVKSNLGSELPDELRGRHERLELTRQSCK